MMDAKEKCESFEWILECRLVHTNHAYGEESYHYLSCIINQFDLYFIIVESGLMKHFEFVSLV